MFKRLIGFFDKSFQRKLLTFNIVLVGLTTLFLFFFLMNSFRTITDFSLDENKKGITQTVEEYLTIYAQEKATSTSLQLEAAQDNLTILGSTAQKTLDNYDAINGNTAVFDIPIFQTELSEERGALTSAADANVDALIPPPIAENPAAKELIYLGDVAKVYRASAEVPSHLIRFGGNSALSLGVSFTAGVNVVKAGAAVSERLQQLEYTRPIGMEISEIYNQPAEVKHSVEGFILNLVEAVVIVIVVLLVFMGLKSGFLIGLISIFIKIS